MKGVAKMPHCRNCGAELKGDEKFCQACGVSVSVTERITKTRTKKSDGIKLILFVVGGIFLLISFGLFLGGSALFWLNTSLADNEGFITTESRQLQTDTYAITFQHVDINVGEIVGGWSVWQPSPSDFLTIKITVSNNNPPKKIFIGIASASDATLYLNDVEYDEITTFDLSISRTIDVENVSHSGNTVPSAPNTQTFWTTQEQGAGAQTLEWSPEPGSYWIILMNEDGSVGVDSTIRFGVNIPLLSTIGIAMLVGGIVTLIIGITIIYFGIRR